MQYGLYRTGVQSRLSRRDALWTGCGSMVWMAFATGASIAPPDGPQSFLTSVIAVDDGRTVRLADGRRIVMPHILPPGPDRHSPMEDTTPIRQSAQALADLVLGYELRVDLDPIAQDRYGRLRAKLSVDDQDIAAQQARNGWVRAFPEPDANQDTVIPLLTAEAEGRTTGKGFWESGFFQVYTADSYSTGTDRFEIVSGRAKRVTRIGDRDHLEFGEDWRTDFTAGLDRSLRKSFDPDAMIGKSIELRGWIRNWNGPFMEITEPTQISQL
ncbi:MAG: thermonuclease family protein [Alphaproteobacteria bacterium]|nr:thermonuclease family protein [Alphaproteobacteria bacterium]